MPIRIQHDSSNRTFMELKLDAGDWYQVYPPF